MAFTPTDDGQVLEAVAEGETGHPPSFSLGNMVKVSSVGQVEISDEASLEDLKTQVESKGHFLELHQHLSRIIW